MPESIPEQHCPAVPPPHWVESARPIYRFIENPFGSIPRIALFGAVAAILLIAAAVL